MLFRAPTQDSSYLALTEGLFSQNSHGNRLCKFSLKLTFWGGKSRKQDETEKLVFGEILGVEMVIRDTQAETSAPASSASVAH